MTPRVQKRIDAFYEWEAAGRGHLLFDHPVGLEPPFRPFDRNQIQTEIIDDGVSDSLGSNLGRLLKLPLSWRKKDSQAEQVEEDSRTSNLSEENTTDITLSEFQVVLPQSCSVSRELSANFLQSLNHCRHPISFEVVGTPDRVVIQFCCRQPDSSVVRRQLEAHFPEATTPIASTSLRSLWSSPSPALIFELGLENEFMLPFAGTSSFSSDPLIGIVGALSELRRGENGVLQVLLQPVRNPWPASMLRAITNGDGSCLFSNAPELLSQTRVKTQRQMYAVVCRIAARSDDYDRVLDIATGIAGALSVLNDPTSNELIPLTNDGYDFDLHRQDLIERRTHRSGMILSSSEVVSLVHPPHSSVRSPKLVREVGKTKAAPNITHGNPTVLGENHHAGESRVVSVSDEQRVRHTHVIGSSGSGKSTLLINLIKQDIQGGGGVGVFDPHGDLIDEVMGYIPEERLDDVILFDPSDDEFPIGLNILSAHSELEKNLLASDLVSVFQRLSTSWGDQMTAVLRNAILAMLESSRGGTLFDLRRFLVEPEFREDFLTTVTDSEVIYFWKREFPMLAGRPQAPLLTRLNTFLGPRLIRNMVAQRENRIDFANIMDGGKIFLAKLSQGTLGEENSYLLGSLLVSKFYQLVMSRQAMEASQRRPFWLYVDEFHNFVCSSMTSILTGARKYRLGLTLAHQELKQIESRDSNVAGAVIANPYTRICFRLGDEDARKLASGFSFFESKDLQNLGIGEAICRIERSDNDFNLSVPLPRPIDNERAKFNQESIRNIARSNYGTKRRSVEEQIRSDIEDRLSEAPPIKRPPAKERSLPAEPPPSKDKPESSKPADAKDKVTPEKPRKQSHESLKDELQKAGERHDYTVSREVLVMGGKGRVDLVFERGEKKIACEIGNTTSVDHEAANIRKCSNAGFQHIAMVALTRDRLQKITDAVGNSVAPKTIVDYFLPEEFAEALKEWAKSEPESGKAERAKHNKAKIDLSSGRLSDEKRRQKEQEMLSKLAKSMKKKGPQN